ncbi:MAG TPA: hypothetical protein VN722_13090 [Hanamia sp.]|nr:hypothetical protein [Hanamia sp.]
MNGSENMYQKNKVSDEIITFYVLSLIEILRLNQFHLYKNLIIDLPHL